MITDEDRICPNCKHLVFGQIEDGGGHVFYAYFCAYDHDRYDDSEMRHVMPEGEDACTLWSASPTFKSSYLSEFNRLHGGGRS